ncbi:ER membrane protein complex subunit 1 [Galdieria sulphuraria]|nr:ER membrane protein complex subunit 1 [Galdieria sulphuraria]
MSATLRTAAVEERGNEYLLYFLVVSIKWLQKRQLNLPPIRQLNNRKLNLYKVDLSREQSSKQQSMIGVWPTYTNFIILFGEPKNIVAVDNHSLLVVSTDGVISKISKSSGDILWRFFHTESKEVFVEQLIPLDPVVLVFVRIDTLSYAEILNLKTGTLQWSYLTCVPGLFNNQFSEETHRGDFQYQRWQLVQDNLAILGCYNRIYLYNLYSEGYSILSYDEPQLEAFQLRLRYSPESERPDLCLIFYDKHDSLLSFGCIPFDDLHDRHGLSIMKTACESELHLLPSDTLSIERTVSLNQDFEILTTSFPSLFTIIRLKENNSIASLKVTPEEIQVEELFRSQLLKCHNWPRSKGCFMTEDLSNHRTRIQYFAVLEEFESLKLTNYSWIVDSSYFGDNIHTFIIPWNELLCYYSTVEELICLELTNVENQTKTKLLWKIDFSMTHIVTHQWLTPSSNHCTTALERSLISFYERNIQLFPRTFRLVFHQLFFGYHQEYPNINALSSSICYSQGILVTVSRCGAVQAHLLDSIGKPTLLWKSYLFDEQPRCLDRNDSIVIFSLDNELILGIWHHRVVYSTNISSNLYHDCIFYLQVDNGKLLKRHCYYSDIPFKVLSWDVRHLLMIYKNGTIQWDSYLQTPLTLKDNFQLVEIDANQLTGYEMDMQLHCTKYLYSLILSRDESICFIRTVHSRDIELKERNVHFLNGSVATKYLNPHLILIVTKRTLSKTGISVYVLDGATGNILYDSHHANASLPVSGVWIENWFLYSLRNLATSRQEIYVGEMLHSVSSSSYDDGLKYEFLETFKEATSQCDSIPQEQFPVVYLQGYEVDIWIRDMVVTQTRNGITPQFLLLHSLDGYLFVIPKLWFHPRRPLVQDSNESSSKDVLQNMPYYPNIPLKPLHKQSEPLFLSLGVEQVVSYPDRFRESCTLIMGFGFEWVVERIAPIGQFDSLPDHFPRVVLFYPS